MKGACGNLSGDKNRQTKKPQHDTSIYRLAKGQGQLSHFSSVFPIMYVTIIYILGHSDENKPSTSKTQVNEKQNNTAEAITQNNIKNTGPAIMTVKEETIKPTDQNKVKAVIVQDTVKIVMQNEEQAANVYKELVKLEQQALVSTAEPFECAVCMDECRPDQGVILRECVHTFCRDCLSNLVRHCEDPDVFCPAMGCRGILQEREIRALVSPEDYERWLARGLAAAESGTRNAFHCRTRDCTGWALCDPGVQKFPCPVCNCTNCIPCQVNMTSHYYLQNKFHIRQL